MGKAGWTGAQERVFRTSTVGAAEPSATRLRTAVRHSPVAVPGVCLGLPFARKSGHADADACGYGARTVALPLQKTTVGQHFS